jgi:hypothetical protein
MFGTIGMRVRRAIIPISFGIMTAAPNRTLRPPPVAARPEMALASRIVRPVNRRAATR